jgi:hypothetical protein
MGGVINEKLQKRRSDDEYIGPSANLRSANLQKALGARIDSLWPRALTKV